MHQISLSEAPADFIGTRALYELIFAKQNGFKADRMPGHAMVAPISRRPGF
jgi:hypothetical protein